MEGFQNRHGPAGAVRTVAVLVAAVVVTGHGPELARESSVAPGVQKVPDVSPALSPEDALKTFYMPPGYRVELVAAEPLIEEPIVIDCDLDGRLWVVEMPGFMRERRPGPMSTTRSAAWWSSRHQPRRADGQAHRVCGRSGPGARVEGPRPRRARRRAAQRLADARHQRRPSIDTKESSPAIRRSRGGTIEHNVNGLYWGWTTGCTPRADRRVPPLKNGGLRGAPDAAARRMGRHAGRRRPHLSQYEQVRAPRRPRSHAVLRAQSQPAAHARQLRTAGERQRRRERRLARAARIPAPIAPTRPASIVRTARWRSSRRSAPRSSTGATGCRRSSTATSLSPSPARTW